MLKGLLSLLLQSNCPLCDRAAAEQLCSYCQRQLQICRVENSHQFWSGDLPLFVWGIYGGQLKRVIAALKYENHPQLGEMLGTFLAETWLDYYRSKTVKNLLVIPIPLHRKRLQKRGFNQAEIIGSTFCRMTGYKFYPQGLKRVRDTQFMFGLSPSEREENVKNAFIINPELSSSRFNLPVLLIDDIYTTGATAREAATVLRTKGIKVLGIAAIASPNIKSDGLSKW